MSNAKILSFSVLAVALTLSAGVARAQDAAPAAPAADAPAADAAPAAAKPAHHHHHMASKKAKAVKATPTDDLNAKSLDAAKANQSFTPPK